MERFTLNRRPAEEPPVESVTLTLNMQEFAALDAVTGAAIAAGHPLRKLVAEALAALPARQYTDLRAAVRGAVSTPAHYPGPAFGKELLG